LKLEPYQPGKPIETVQRELGLKSVIKLASNENPLGPSPKALRKMRACLKDGHLYPDGACEELRLKLLSVPAGTRWFFPGGLSRSTKPRLCWREPGPAK
jgi:histidinol-phosphate/aromatic aminotransferase/cobyric acid decarboxylase-like protein